MKREVLGDIERTENYQRKDRLRNETAAPKKEVDFVAHSPPQVQSKNVAGPPVYYPPGSAEFTKKESAEGGMMQGGVSIKKYENRIISIGFIDTSIDFFFFLYFSGCMAKS